jgi:predicted small lipoprotein YifL
MKAMIRTLTLLALLATALAACRAGPWGPLAVSDEEGQGALQARGGAGPLRIGPTCVTLLVEEVDREITLVWRSGQTSWDQTARQIVFEDLTAGEMRLSNGDRIEVGGAGISDPGDPDQGAAQPKWLSRPDGSCPDELFAVHSVRRIQP